MRSTVHFSTARTKATLLGLGVVGLIASLIGWVVARREFFVGYLFAWVVLLGISLGSLGLLMIHHLTGGRWGYSVRRFLEAAVGNLPLLALLFIPIFFGLSELYPWHNPAVLAANEAVAKKHIYLNTTGFVIRAIVLFAIWITIGSLLRKWSAEQDLTASVEPTRKMRTLSGPGLVIYPVTMTFAAVDWIMSTEPDWYSTMFPVLMCISQILGALALIILLLSIERRRPQFEVMASEETFHKFGNLLLAFTMMWAYLAFAQFLIIWSGNLPHEISWYLHRIRDGWRWAAAFVALFYFFVPFFLLLMRPVKKNPNVLAAVACCVLSGHVVAIWWMVAPSFHSDHFVITWPAITALLGIGCIWAAAFLRNMETRPLIPLNDPRFAVAIPA